MRLEPGTAAALRRLGFDTVGGLAAAHRPSLALRFGPAVGRRLDQASGAAAETIETVRPPEIPCARLAFAEPLRSQGGLNAVLRQLAGALCAELERRGLGAVLFDLAFRRVDGAATALRAGAARATRDPARVVRLFGERLGAVDPGFGVEAASLAAPRAMPLTPLQPDLRGAGEPPAEPDLAPLVEAIAARIGARRLYRVAPVESDLPERSERRVPPLAPPLGLAWGGEPRPALLLDPPEPVEAVALLPDQPPRFFVWRGRRVDVARADGPERVHGEWWADEAEADLTRDYYRAECRAGLRYWLFRAGVGPEAGGPGARWFLQGAFG